MTVCDNCGSKSNDYNSIINRLDNDFMNILRNLINRERENNRYSYSNEDLYVFNQGIMYGLKVALIELNKYNNEKITMTS